MCLDRVTKFLDPPQERTFYKVMYKGKNGRYFGLFRHYRPYMALGKVYHSTPRRLVPDNVSWEEYQGKFDHYTSGFHGFASLKDALLIVDGRYWFGRVYVVKCTGLVHTMGYEGKRRTYVASTMKILKEVWS